MRLEAGQNFGVVQRWRFVATAVAGNRARETVAASDPFWSLAGLVFNTGPARTRLRQLLHRLAQDGWEPWGHGEASSRGRAWYAHSSTATAQIDRSAGDTPGWRFWERRR